MSNTGLLCLRSRVWIFGMANGLFCLEGTLELDDGDKLRFKFFAWPLPTDRGPVGEGLDSVKGLVEVQASVTFPVWSAAEWFMLQTLPPGRMTLHLWRCLHLPSVSLQVFLL